VSVGSDGRTNDTFRAFWPPSESWRDIIMVDGQFIASPEGIARFYAE
jgi:hypothetical protein